MENLLLVGFIFGLRHAIESDHIAAIASLTNQSNGLKTAAKIGVVWGVGHTLILFVVGGVVLLMDSVMPKNMATMLEWFAGLMLVLIGLDMLRRVVKTRINVHSKFYHDDLRQINDHCTKNERVADDASLHCQHHHHSPAGEFPLRAFIVGLIHGLAGSAALVLLTLSTAETKWVGLSYILIFGLGIIIGMGMLSLAIALPLNKMKNIGYIYHLVCISGGFFTIIVGGFLLNEHTVSMLGLI